MALSDSVWALKERALEQDISEAVLDKLAGMAAKETRKMTTLVLRAIAEDMALTFGEDSNLIHEVLGRRAHSRDRGQFASIRNASAPILSKVIVAMIIRQELGSQQARNAILKAFRIDAKAVEREVSERVRREFEQQKAEALRERPALRRLA
jgi:hypothetical protein